MTLISGQLCVSSAAQYNGTEGSSTRRDRPAVAAPRSVTLGTVTHVSALPSCAAHFLDLTGLSVIAASLEIL
jgi:hypothetical protein